MHHDDDDHDDDDDENDVDEEEEEEDDDDDTSWTLSDSRSAASKLAYVCKLITSIGRATIQWQDLPTYEGTWPCDLLT